MMIRYYAQFVKMAARKDPTSGCYSGIPSQVSGYNGKLESCFRRMGKY